MFCYITIFDNLLSEFLYFHIMQNTRLVIFQICVNDDLVAKKFAVYISKSAADTWLDEVDQLPVMLNSSILNQTVCMTSNKLPAKTQPPPGKHTDSHIFKTYMDSMAVPLGVCICKLIHMCSRVINCSEYFGLRSESVLHSYKSGLTLSEVTKSGCSWSRWLADGSLHSTGQQQLSSLC